MVYYGNTARKIRLYQGLFSRCQREPVTVLLIKAVNHLIFNNIWIAGKSPAPSIIPNCCTVMAGQHESLVSIQRKEDVGNERQTIYSVV